MKSKKGIIRFNQLKKDSSMQEVLEYFNKEFSLIVTDPKERHYFDLEDCGNFFFETREDGINFVKINMTIEEDYKIIHRNGRDHYLLSLLGMGMVIKFKSEPAVKLLFHQSFLSNFENLIVRFNNLTKRHSALIKKHNRASREDGILCQQNFEQAKTIKAQEERIKELEAELLIARRNTPIIGISRIKKMFIRLTN